MNKSIQIGKPLSLLIVVDFRCSCICLGQLFHHAIDIRPDNHDVPLKHTNEEGNQESDASQVRLPETSESTTVLVGSVSSLERHAAAFVRLGHGCYLGNLMEVNVPVRFLFVLLVPENEQTRCKEIGRSIAAMMSDKTFLMSAYQFKVCVYNIQSAL